MFIGSYGVAVMPEQSVFYATKVEEKRILSVANSTSAKE